MSKNKLSESAQKLVDHYGLVADPNDPKNSDIFFSSHFTIITRQGIDKVAAKADIGISHEVVSNDPYEVVIKGTYSMKDRKVETFGEASIDRPEVNVLARGKSITKEGETTEQSISFIETSILKKGNVKQNPPYLFAMAEKRANSRGVLKITGFYDEGIYGQDEADDFNDLVSNSRKSAKSSASSQGKSVTSTILN